VRNSCICDRFSAGVPGDGSITEFLREIGMGDTYGELCKR
jgi:hypothetical protein